MDGILIVSFGTSCRESRQKTVDVLIEHFQEIFDQIPIYLAFTSRVIIKKIFEQEQISIDTVEEALKRMCKEGISRVFIQPTHMINGIENEEMMAIAEKYEKLFSEGIYIGTPLLTDIKDYGRVLEVLIGEIEKMGVILHEMGDTAVILMGHGTTHFANAVYSAFDYLLKERGYENFYVGTVEGYPDIDTVLKLIQRKEIKKIILVPFMFVAGEHALNDMAGSGEKSWKSIFEQEGYDVVCIMKGMGEYPGIRECYVEHMKKRMKL